MIVATRLSAVWQVAGVAAAALCCYLVSQSVAAERAGLARVDREVAATHDDIARLQTEIGVRGRMGQLERWNTEVLALQAPRPGQFVASGVQLASLYGRKRQPVLPVDPVVVAQRGPVEMVAYRPAPQPAPPAMASPVPDIVAGQPLLRNATYVRPAPDRLAANGPAAAASGPIVQKVSFQQEVQPEGARKAPATVKAPARAAGLLPADIGLLAEREADGTRDSRKAAR